MTEDEWLVSAIPQCMLKALTLSERKERLCTAGWCRALFAYRSWFNIFRWPRQLDAAEAYADGHIDQAALRHARGIGSGPHNLLLRACRASKFSIQDVVDSLSACMGEFGVPPAKEVCDILRDVAGNPFLPVAREPRWLMSNVVELAGIIYEEKAFDRLPILADALMDAGCSDEQVLVHCRSEGPHVRGCWVVDLLLGKA